MAIFSAIGYAVGYAIGFLGAAAGLSTATILSIAGVAGNLVTSAVLSAVARALAPSVNVPRAEIQALISQTDAPRRIYVGQNLVGGIRAFFDVKGDTLYQLVVVQHGALSDFVRFWIDSEPVNLDADGNVTSGPKSGYVRTIARLGTGQGGNYPSVVNNFSNWNASRRLQGQATFLVEARAPKGNDFMKVFPKAYNTAFQWVIRGQAVYNPTSGQTAYSDNAALVIAHYLTHPDGYRLDPTEINWDSVAAMRAVAAQPVPQMGGGNAPSLRLWGYWTLDEEPTQVLARMHTSSGIRAYEMQDGRIGLIGGPHGEPACTLTAKDIKEIQTSEAISEREGYNVLRVFHMSAAQKYEVIEVEAWRDEARLAIEGEIAQEMKLDMCPNRSQARRLAKQQIHDDNRARVTIITNLVGLKARWPRFDGQRHTILLDYRPEDGSGRQIVGEYEVMNHEFDPVGLECRIELGRVNRAAMSWTAAEEGETTAELPASEGNPPPPMSAVLSQRILQISAGNRQPVLEIDALPIAGREDLTIEAQYRRVGDGTWIEMAVSDLRAQAGAIEDGQQYEARARWRGVFDGIAPWNSLGPITIQIDAVPPGQPTELFASNGAGHIRLSWRSPSGSFFAIRIYRGTATNIANAIDVDGAIYDVYEFASTEGGSISFSKAGDVEYLIVGGGGAGGTHSSGGGGGGAGGFLEDVVGVSVDRYNVEVGLGGVANSSALPDEQTGHPSSFAGLTSFGGGVGKGNVFLGLYANGASGGGEAWQAGYRGVGQGIPGQGHDGGLGFPSPRMGGGGGGAGGPGGNAVGNTTTGHGGHGGIGRISSITGFAQYYAGGGGGGVFDTNHYDIVGIGGLGGGGAGGTRTGSPRDSTPGVDGTGGGGGGGGPTLGKNGGSGIVILRVATPVESTDPDPVTIPDSPQKFDLFNARQIKTPEGIWLKAKGAGRHWISTDAG